MKNGEGHRSIQLKSVHHQFVCHTRKWKEVREKGISIDGVNVKKG